MTKDEKARLVNEESYEAIAVEFDETRQEPWDELRGLTKDVADGHVILDCGCGNGRLLKALPNVNFDYIGFDQNEYLLEKAHERYPEHTFVTSSLEGYEYGELRFDRIYCIAAFHHLVGMHDRIAVLENWRRALKSGGMVVMTVWNLWQWKYIRFLFTFLSTKVDWNDFFIPWRSRKPMVRRYYHGFTKAELRHLFERTGFSRVRIESVGSNYIVQAIK